MPDIFKEHNEHGNGDGQCKHPDQYIHRHPGLGEGVHGSISKNAGAC